VEDDRRAKGVAMRFRSTRSVIGALLLLVTTGVAPLVSQQAAVPPPAKPSPIKPEANDACTARIGAIMRRLATDPGTYLPSDKSVVEMCRFALDLGRVNAAVNDPSLGLKQRINSERIERLRRTSDRMVEEFNQNNASARFLASDTSAIRIFGVVLTAVDFLALVDSRLVTDNTEPRVRERARTEAAEIIRQYNGFVYDLPGAQIGPLAVANLQQVLSKLDQVATEALDRPAKVAGRWELTDQGSRGPASAVTLTIEQIGNQVKGSRKPRGGAAAALTGTIRGNQIQFTVSVHAPSGDSALEYAGTVEGDTMKGTVKTSGTGVEWAAKRIK
jgi:hypothetical protein